MGSVSFNFKTVKITRLEIQENPETVLKYEGTAVLLTQKTIAHSKIVQFLYMQFSSQVLKSYFKIYFKMIVTGRLVTYQMNLSQNVDQLMT